MWVYCTCVQLSELKRSFISWANIAISRLITHVYVTFSMCTYAEIMRAKDTNSGGSKRYRLEDWVSLEARKS